MAKVQKRFYFSFPLAKMRYDVKSYTLAEMAAGHKNGQVVDKVAELDISYIGYDYETFPSGCRETGEERFGVDVDSIEYKGVELFDLFQSDMFGDIWEQIYDAAMNNVAYQFSEQRILDENY